MTPRERAYWLNRVLDVYTLRENEWVQKTYAATTGGLNVSWLHPAAVAYCVDGALELVAAENDLAREQVRELRGVLIWVAELDPGDAFALEHWNDEQGRTFADVRRLLTTAIELQAIG